MAAPRVLFVSKPIAPPWNDGSKNLVRDVATHLTRACPTVLSVPGPSTLGDRVSVDAVYSAPGGFAPAVTQNARVLRRLLSGDPLDLWHFVFAPNPVSSTVAGVAIRSRRALGWKGRVVQTVASAPRSFDGVARLLFGDAVVVVSEWMRGRLLGAGVTRPVAVIPPCAAEPAPRSEEAVRRVRAELEAGDAPIVLYPGDYEVSQGAITVARAVREITRRAPGTLVVFACRQKTAASGAAREAIERELRAEGVLGETRRAGDVPDMHALLAASSVVAFPVDDLYGKVDVPLVLLEALALEVPIVLARGGPLEAVATARFVEPEDHEALAAEVVGLLTDPKGARDAAKAGRALYQARFTPRVVAAAYDDLYDRVLAGER